MLSSYLHNNNYYAGNLKHNMFIMEHKIHKLKLFLFCLI